MNNTLHILNLEDNPYDSELIQDRLNDYDIHCEILRVETRDEYIHALVENAFDLILADYSLPGFDGLSALEIAVEKSPSTPFIFVSGVIGEDLAIETLKKGATDYVLKNRLQRLGPAVRRAILEQRERNERKKAEQELLKAHAELEARVEERTAELSILAASLQQEIGERKRIEEEMRHMAHHDVLTGLPNRRLYIDIISVEAAQARRHRTRMALLFMDLDRFKEINDTLGHEVGDKLLIEVAGRLKATVRESDTVARTGGDEFNIVLADIKRVEVITSIARKIIESFKKPFNIAGHALNITTSIGVSIFPDDSENADALLRYADIAMYYAKEQGRNSFQYYNPDINTRSIERMRMEGMLRQTIDRRELAVVYQPQININSLKMVCAEVLVRWNHPEMGTLEPKHFIVAAEETGFITAIDEFVLKASCDQIRLWLEAGLPPVCITVNLSAREFQNPELIDRITRILHESGVPPQCLDVEITETLAMSNIDRTIIRLNELAKIGVHISIDDFGTGYSSLNYLKRLPVEKLKIDKSFIRDIATDSDDRAIITAVIAMAHSMKIKVLAEGVENRDQLAFLQESGCDEAQGFFFSEPMPAAKFKKMIEGGMAL